MVQRSGFEPRPGASRPPAPREGPRQAWRQPWDSPASAHPIFEKRARRNPGQEGCAVPFGPSATSLWEHPAFREAATRPCHQYGQCIVRVSVWQAASAISASLAPRWTQGRPVRYGDLPVHQGLMNPDLTDRWLRAWVRRGLPQLLSPAVMGGRPCIRGLRVTVGMVVGLLAAGEPRARILAAYPYLEAADLDEALAYAAWRLEEREEEVVVR